jgi:hypothetical protein
VPNGYRRAWDPQRGGGSGHRPRVNAGRRKLMRLAPPRMRSGTLGRGGRCQTLWLPSSPPSRTPRSLSEVSMRDCMNSSWRSVSVTLPSALTTDTEA